MPSQIFNLDFSSPHKPAVSSPLSSSPIRPSQGHSNSSPPLSPRNPNTLLLLPRRDSQSSPVRDSQPSNKLFKYASRSAKPNPLLPRQGRENAQESRRKMFLKNVRQRADDKTWLRRGGDQEVNARTCSSLLSPRFSFNSRDMIGGANEILGRRR